jgi:hypothetical protein
MKTLPIDLAGIRKRAQKAIDTDWKYSWHWGKNSKERHWTMDAKHDAIERISNVEKELLELRKIYQELTEICPIYIPGGEE